MLLQSFFYFCYVKVLVGVQREVACAGMCEGELLPDEETPFCPHESMSFHSHVTISFFLSFFLSSFLSFKKKSITFFAKTSRLNLKYESGENKLFIKMFCID
jgi:hypothetical protein